MLANVAAFSSGGPEEATSCIGPGRAPNPVIITPVVRQLIATILALVVLGASAAVFSPAAFADGDPASDILSSLRIFDPPDLRQSAVQHAKLIALVNYVSAHGLPLKVAMVPSSGDMGSANFLWENASGYASKYLGIELKYLLHGSLLVVMPQTDGLYDPVPQKDIPAGDNKAMRGLAPAGSNLVPAAYEIVQRLASDNGIQVPRNLAYTIPTAAKASSSATPLIGFAVGLIMIALAWGASLRARPLRRSVPA